MSPASFFWTPKGPPKFHPFVTSDPLIQMLLQCVQGLVQSGKPHGTIIQSSWDHDLVYLSIETCELGVDPRLKKWMLGRHKKIHMVTYYRCSPSPNVTFQCCFNSAELKRIRVTPRGAIQKAAFSKLLGGLANSIRLQSNHMSTCKMDSNLGGRIWDLISGCPYGYGVHPKKKRLKNQNEKGFDMNLVGLGFVCFVPYITDVSISAHSRDLSRLEETIAVDLGRNSWNPQPWLDLRRGSIGSPLGSWMVVIYRYL